MSKVIGLTLAISLLYGPAFAQVSPGRAQILEEIALCRSINTDPERLACYDRTTVALEAAERSGEVVVLDRQQVREANRQLFGFQLSNPFVGRGGTAEEPELSEIETTLASASMSSDGKWVFRLSDGAEWRQIDSGRVQFHNRSGAEVRVRRASLGSYMLTVGNSRAVRVRRQ